MRFVKKPSKNEIITEIENNYSIDFNFNKSIVKISSKNPLLEVNAQKSIEAFMNGFSIKDSLKIFEEDKDIRFINIKNYTSNRNRAKHQTGRVIGENGKTKDKIEELTGTKISIKNFQIGIIGKIESILTTEKAIKKILSGSPISNVYYDLEQYNSSTNKIEYIEKLN